MISLLDLHFTAHVPHSPPFTPRGQLHMRFPSCSALRHCGYVHGQSAALTSLNSTSSLSPRSHIRAVDSDHVIDDGSRLSLTLIAQPASPRVSRRSQTALHHDRHHRS